MKDQVLSIEQMHKLKELGVECNKHSIYWCRQIIQSENGISYGIPFVVSGICTSQPDWEFIPTFTLQDIIELIPSNVIKYNTEFYLIIDKSTIGYIDITEEYLAYKSYNGILNNCYNMLVCLAENKYI